MPMLTQPYPFVWREGTAENYFRLLAKTPEGKTHIAAFFNLLSDLKKIEEYIEPSNTNLTTYSYRTFQLYLSLCTEIESNFKLILLKNDYPTAPDNMNVTDYKKLNPHLKLSEYKVKYNKCDFIGIIQPFINFDTTSPDWWKAYNDVKHNRASKFELASYNNLVNAISALFVLLHSQYGKNTFYATPLFCNDNGAYEEFPQDFSLVNSPSWIENEKYNCILTSLNFASLPKLQF